MQRVAGMSSTKSPAAIQTGMTVTLLGAILALSGVRGTAAEPQAAGDPPGREGQRSRAGD
jgi:hypothetical protein